MSTKADQGLQLKIRLQWLLLALERLGQAAHWPLMAMALILALLFSGILSFAGQSAAVIILVLMAAGLFYSFYRALQISVPSKREAMRQLERASGLDHREISSTADALTSQGQSAETLALWHEHQRRQRLSVTALKFQRPRSLWRQLDPLALRVPVGLALVAAFFLGSGTLLSSLRGAGSADAVVAAPPLALDAWLKPPAYTGKPPLLLTSPAMLEKLASDPSVTAPENSTVTIRLGGTEKPVLSFYALNTNGTAAEPLMLPGAKLTITDKTFSAEFPLGRPLYARLDDNGHEIAAWAFSVIPDQAPQISFSAEPKPEGLGALKLGFKASDDYGVKSVAAELTLSDQQENGTGFEGNGVFLFDPPVFKIALKTPNAKTVDDATTQDLASHPWAGLYVDMTLTATDAAGHKTTTPPRRFKLPERAFFKPLARALIEQRKSLVASPDNAPDVATMMTALLTYPLGLEDKSGLLLNLSRIRAALANAGSTDAVVEAVGDLWPLIVALEDGAAADARVELKALKRQLEDALKNGATDEQIAQLTDKMRKAMDRLMDQLRKEGQKRQADGQPAPKGKSLSKQDLQKMLDAIQNLSKGGAKDKAQDLLSQLDQMLQNLQPGGKDQADGGGDSPLQDQLNALSDLMKKQQGLMDKTQRLGQGEQPRPGGKGDGQGEKPGDGQPLAGEQGDLQTQLDGLAQGLDGEPRQQLGKAGKSMGAAKDALNQNGKDEALQQQGEALKAMRDGAGKLSEKLSQQQQSGGATENSSGKDDDPLGRPRATRDPGVGPNKNLIPSEMAMQRAREILEELRARSGAQSLSPEDRAYIERLLQGLY